MLIFQNLSLKMGTTMDFTFKLEDFGSETALNGSATDLQTADDKNDNHGVTIRVDTATGILKRNDSGESFSSSPGSSETSDSRAEDPYSDVDSDSFIDCGHDDFPFCHCLAEKSGSGGQALQCEHDDFPFCDCLSKSVGNAKNKKALGFRHGKRQQRRGYNIGASLCAFRDGGLEVFDETEESDFQESETEAETPRGLESDSEDTEGAGLASDTEGAVGYTEKENEEKSSSGLLSPPGPLGTPGSRRASIVTCDSRKASVESNQEPIRIAVFGTDGVGKSALIVRLLTGRFIGEYDPTMEAVYSYQIPLPGHDLPLQVMDTAGHVDVVDEGRETQVSWGEGFLLVFSLTSHTSFTALSHLRRVILELTPGAPRPLVVVGNKADLSHLREVNDDEIRDLADCWGCDYFEVAAPEPWEVVVRPFTALYQSIVDARESR